MNPDLLFTNFDRLSDTPESVSRLRQFISSSRYEANSQIAIQKTKRPQSCLNAFKPKRCVE
jgi:hypothetical protein